MPILKMYNNPAGFSLITIKIINLRTKKLSQKKRRRRRKSMRIIKI